MVSDKRSTHHSNGPVATSRAGLVNPFVGPLTQSTQGAHGGESKIGVDVAFLSCLDDIVWLHKRAAIVHKRVVRTANEDTYHSPI
jgi:hypothetical protein